MYFNITYYNSQLATRNSQVATRNSQVASRKSQVASRKSQVASNLVHLKLHKVKSFFLSFQTIHKIFSLHPLCLFLVILLSLNSSALICLISVLCVLFYFNETLITQMIMIRYDFIISDHHLNQRPLRSIIRKIHQ
jgi:hypothetical protein